MKKLFFSLPLVLAVSASLAADSEDKARKFFAQYVALEKAFDPAVVELYSDEARIQNTRIYPTGQERVLTLPAAQYKQLLLQALPLAKERGDTNAYSEVKYTPEGDRVRITATRYSDLKKYSSPISLLVGPAADGKWQILEEITQSRP